MVGKQAGRPCTATPTVISNGHVMSDFSLMTEGKASNRNCRSSTASPRVRLSSSKCYYLGARSTSSRLPDMLRESRVAYALSGVDIHPKHRRLV